MGIIRQPCASGSTGPQHQQDCWASGRSAPPLTHIFEVGPGEGWFDKAGLVLEAVNSQIPISFRGDPKCLCPHWGRIQDLVKGSGVRIVGPLPPSGRRGVAAMKCARGFLYMGTQPVQACSPWLRCPGGSSSPGGGNKGLLQLSPLLSAQSLHKPHIHCRLLHPASRQESSPGPQGSAGTGGVAVPQNMPVFLLPSQCPNQGPEPFSSLLEAPLLPTPTRPWPPTLCGIEGLVGGREAPTADAMICPKKDSQLVVRGDEAPGWRFCSTEPAGSKQQSWCRSPWPSQRAQGPLRGWRGTGCSRGCQRAWEAWSLTPGT